MYIFLVGWKVSRFRIKTLIFLVPCSGRHFHSASAETQSSNFIGCQKNEVCPWLSNNKLFSSLVHGRDSNSTIAVSQSLHVSLLSFWQFAQLSMALQSVCREDVLLCTWNKRLNHCLHVIEEQTIQHVITGDQCNSGLWLLQAVWVP